MNRLMCLLMAPPRTRGSRRWAKQHVTQEAFDSLLDGSILATAVAKRETDRLAQLLDELMTETITLRDQNRQLRKQLNSMGWTP